MSEKDLKKELNDDELEEVNGGAGFINAAVGAGGTLLRNAIMTPDVAVTSDNLVLSGGTKIEAGPLGNAVKVNSVKVVNDSGSDSSGGGILV